MGINWQLVAWVIARSKLFPSFSSKWDLPEYWGWVGGIRTLGFEFRVHEMWDSFTTEVEGFCDRLVMVLVVYVTTSISCKNTTQFKFGDIPLGLLHILHYFLCTHDVIQIRWCSSNSVMLFRTTLPTINIVTISKMITKQWIHHVIESLIFTI